MSRMQTQPRLWNPLCWRDLRKPLTSSKQVQYKLTEALKCSTSPVLPGPLCFRRTALASPVVRSHWPLVWRADAEKVPQHSTLIVSSKAKWLSSLSWKQQGEKSWKSYSKQGSRKMEIKWIYSTVKMCKMSLAKTRALKGCHVLSRVSIFSHYLVLCGLSFNLKPHTLLIFIQVFKFLNSKLANFLTLFLVCFRKLAFLLKVTDAHLHTHSDTHVHPQLER